MKGPQRVGVLGGGLAGLALAALLAARGHDVTVYERDRPGGKLRRELVAGQAVDTGPSLFTLPEVWHALLARLEEPDPLDLRPLPGGLGLHHTPFGPVPLPVPPGHALHRDWQQYVQAAEPLRAHLPTLLTTPPGLMDRAFLRASAALLRVTAPHATAEGWIAAQRLPPALAHALRTHALNAGLTPPDAPALYALIPALVGERVYRPARGMGALLDALLSFARTRGVQVRAGEGVARVHGTHLTLRGGRTAPHDVLVSAIDPQRLRALMGRPTPTAAGHRTVSGVALYGRLDESADLPRTSVLPPGDFRHFRTAMHAAALPDDTLALVHAEGRALAVLLTAPATGLDLGVTHPWVQGQLRRVQDALGQRILFDPAVPVLALTPAHYALGGHAGGAIYGSRLPVWRGGPLHPQPYRLNRGVWQVGGGVHPGGGIPAVLGGALIVDRLMREAGT